MEKYITWATFKANRCFLLLRNTQIHTNLPPPPTHMFQIALWELSWDLSTSNLDLAKKQCPERLIPWYLLCVCVCVCRLYRAHKIISIHLQAGQTRSLSLHSNTKQITQRTIHTHEWEPGKNLYGLWWTLRLSGLHFLHTQNKKKQNKLESWPMSTQKHDREEIRGVGAVLTFEHSKGFCPNVAPNWQEETHSVNGTTAINMLSACAYVYCTERRKPDLTSTHVSLQHTVTTSLLKRSI